MARFIKFIKHELLLFTAVMLTAIFGVFMVYSASFGMEGNFWQRQLLFLICSIPLMGFLILFDYQKLRRYSRVLYIVTLLLLFFLLLFGTPIRHTKAWFSLGPFSFQPSELAKFTVILMLADYLSSKKQGISTIQELLWSLLLVGVPMLLILKQPDVGTAFVFFPPLLAMLYVSGVSKRYLIYIFSVMLLTAGGVFSLCYIKLLPINPEFVLYFTSLKFLFVCQVVVFLFLVFLYLVLRICRLKVRMWHFTSIFLVFTISIFLSFILDLELKDYQRKRLVGFLSPNIDPLGTSYNLIQSKIAIGSGKLFGKGYLLGTQGQLGFVPERHTDFIFSVLAEEFGFFGVCILCFLYFFILYKGIWIAARSADLFGCLLAVGIVSWIGFQVLMNIGVTMGLFPLTGIPLPLISYGGSSLFVTLSSLGVLINISIRRSLLYY